MLDNPPGDSTLFFNVGDDIQALAAGQYYPNQDFWWDKNDLSNYSGGLAKYISNGWFMKPFASWPPSSSLQPFYVSFHLNESAQLYMLTSQGIKHFKQNQPIGCRDTNTVKILNQYGIEAYFSGCLTTTLRRSQFTEKTSRNGIYLVDVLYKLPSKADWKVARRNQLSNLIRKKTYRPIQFRESLIEKIIAPDLMNEAIEIKHSNRIGDSSLKFRVSYAKDILKTYAEAELVITSRIHCALPCLAFGTPVIFVNGGLSTIEEKCRIEGLSDWFHNIFVDEDGKITSDFEWSGSLTNQFKIKNKKNYFEYAEKMRSQCEQLIANK
jgi:hypothetical protein